MSETTMTLRLPSAEKKLIKSYATLHGASMSEIMRKAVLERIEDEFDARELETAIETSSGVTIPFEDIVKKYGL